MFSLKDILEILDRWPSWKRVKEAPDRIDELERRLAALEEKAPSTAGQPCPACGEPAVRRTSSKPHSDTFMRLAGIKLETWKCTACGDEEQRNTKPGE